MWRAWGGVKKCMKGFLNILKIFRGLSLNSFNERPMKSYSVKLFSNLVAP